VYTPIYFYWIWLCLRNRSIFFFNTANPSIKNGGFLMESKKEIYDLLQKESYPSTMLFSKTNNTSKIIEQLRYNDLKYPMIGKPDIGMQGLAVKKLENEIDVITYANASQVDFLIQEFIPYENEVGIFYYRYPSEDKGHISGIVGKQFLTVIGDGYSSIEQLLEKDSRYILQLPYLKSTKEALLKKILTAGESEILVPYGNHARGAKFIDLSHMITSELETSFDRICRQIDGFYFGRLDIRYKSWEELEQGSSFSIVELNGAGSEPTHMYDPKHSVFYAWKEIIKHLCILSRISRMNHHQRQIPYLGILEGIKMLKENSRYVKLIKEQHHSKPVTVEKCQSMIL
jgi:hypothetical protein